MRLKGGFTLEAAIIFPLITAVVVGIIMLDLVLHDKLLSDVSKILGGMRYYEAERFYYDAGFEQIRLQKIACSPVIGEDSDFARQQKRVISNLSIDYYLQNKIGFEPQYTATDIGEVFDLNDNAALVRAGGRVVQIIGGD